MRYFQPYVFFFFVVINVTSTLFCARKRPFEGKDPVDVYYGWFYETFAVPNNLEIVKKEVECGHGHQRLSQTCSKIHPPISFEAYCKKYKIDKSCVRSYSLLKYVKNILEPWVIDARERQLPRPVPNTIDVAVFNELEDKLSWSVSNILVEYNHEPTFRDHGVEGKQIVHIKRNFSDGMTFEYAVQVLPETTFSGFLNDVGVRANIGVDNIRLTSMPKFVACWDSIEEPVEDMKKLVYAILSRRVGGGLMLEKKEVFEEQKN